LRWYHEQRVRAECAEASIKAAHSRTDASSCDGCDFIQRVDDLEHEVETANEDRDESDDKLIAAERRLAEMGGRSDAVTRYPHIADCAKCRDCKDPVHDYHVPDDLWAEVVGQEIVLCWDCFAARAWVKDGDIGLLARAPLPANLSRSDAVGEVETLKGMLADAEGDIKRQREINEELAGRLAKAETALISRADKLAGSATPEPHPPNVPEITPEVAEQLRRESDECSAAMAAKVTALRRGSGPVEPHPDAGPGEVVVAVSPDIGSAIAATTWDEASERALSEWGDHALIHRVPIHGAPQPEKDGAECIVPAQCSHYKYALSVIRVREFERDHAFADLAAARKTKKKLRIERDKLQADLAAEREAHEETTSGLTGEINRLRRLRDDERARAEKAEQELAIEKRLHLSVCELVRGEGDARKRAVKLLEHARESNARLSEAFDDERCRAEELETQLDSTRHRASEAEARAAHELRLARHQGEQRIKAEKRVRELETQLEAVGDAAVRSLVQLAEKHSQNEPCAVSCEYFHCDSLLPRCGKTGETFPTKDDCPLPEPPRPSTESGEKPCLTCENLNQSEGVCKLDPNRFGSCVRYMDWKANKAKQSGEGSPCETCESRQYREVQSELRCTEWRSCPEYRNNKEKTMIDADRIGEIGVKGPSTEQVDSAAQSGRANREGMELVGERIREAEKG
jgi:hypothetical protein